MKRFIIGFIILATVFSLSSCSGGKGCKGGGWYGNRNLSFVPAQEMNNDMTCKEEMNEKLAEEQTAMP